MSRPRVALLLVVVGDLGGSGGAERLFSALHEHFATSAPGVVTLITARSSLRRLREAGYLRTADAVDALPLGREPGRGKVAIAWMTLQLLWLTALRRFDLVHICLPSPVYVPFAAALRVVPRRWRPRLTLTVVDCTLATSLDVPPPHGTYERQVLDAHRLYDRWTRLDGIFSWYRAFVEADRGGSAAVVRAARFCFTDPDRFRPAATKLPLIIFAGRFSEQKRPLLFVEAVARLRQAEPGLVNRYRFRMYGKGALQAQVNSRITELGLEQVIEVTHAVDMAPVFAESQLFISTQAIENFTSLSMLESMAAGNAIIAEDVGQTREFVRHGENGLLVSEPTADAFAAALAAYLRAPEWHAPMARSSRAIATDVQTRERFADDITAFWQAVVSHE